MGARIAFGAFDSAALFHLERAVAVLGSYLLMLVVVARAWSGQLPSELSTQGLTYAAEEATETTSDAMAAVSGELASLRERMERIERSVK